MSGEHDPRNAHACMTAQTMNDGDDVLLVKRRFGRKKQLRPRLRRGPDGKSLTVERSAQKQTGATSEKYAFKFKNPVFFFSQVGV